MNEKPIDSLKTPPKNFHALLFERVDSTKNEQRFYRLAWESTLIDPGAVVRIYGRKGGWQRVLSPTPFASLSEAWPAIRKHIRTRLRHGYQIVRLKSA